MIPIVNDVLSSVLIIGAYMGALRLILAYNRP